MAFLVAKNALELNRPIAVKLQKKDQDIVAALNMIDETISNIKDLRENIETEFFDWFSELKELWKLLVVKLVYRELLGNKFIVQIPQQMVLHLQVITV